MSGNSTDNMSRDRPRDLSGHRGPFGRASWDDPDCPDCESEVFVGRLKSIPNDGATHICHLCGRRFAVDPERDAA